MKIVAHISYYLSCVTNFRVFDGVSLMDDFSLHATSSSTFTYCSSYGVDCKLALRTLKKKLSISNMTVPCPPHTQIKVT